ncbi:nudix hydrolase 1 [Aspergillus novoparasiticus]|uniref:Nudix hydrolase 1 n=1 Tax=Aspergillus novoparasiticus TaxID=986946 RepID=A0A5N6ET99_9EURO|nr:nudix hydrolase 1 [Aspergillus novoparasiticus]
MSAQDQRVVRTGVNVFVFNNQGQFVMGLRKGSHGEGTWGLPGGHIDFFEESLEACAAREINEETGFKIFDIEFLTVTNDVFKEEKKHYTTNFLAAKLVGGTGDPLLNEPEKCFKWKWFSWEEVEDLYKAQDAAEKAGKIFDFKGQKLFLPTMNLFRQRAKLHPLKAYNAILESEKKPVVGSASN